MGLKSSFMRQFVDRERYFWLAVCLRWSEILLNVNVTDKANFSKIKKILKAMGCTLCVILPKLLACRYCIYMYYIYCKYKKITAWWKSLKLTCSKTGTSTPNSIKDNFQTLLPVTKHWLYFKLATHIGGPGDTTNTVERLLFPEYRILFKFVQTLIPKDVCVTRRYCRDVIKKLMKIFS